MTLERPATNLSDQEWRERLRKEIKEAHRDWENANRFFEYALGQDQVDYAIYAIITAEKRYEMLLRLAKRTCKHWPQWGGVM